jgi:heavy metal translocating P-type ATPase
MSRSSCDECGGPVGAGGLRGRAWPHRLPATYCCYGCLSLGERARQQGSGQADTSHLGGLGFRLGIALVVAGQSTIFGLALNLHDDVPAAVRSLVQWLIFASTLVVFALLGGGLVRTARAELRNRRLTIEVLFLLTMFGAIGASLQAQISGRGKIYFEVVSILLVVYTVGKLVGARSRAKVIAATRAWSGQLISCRVGGEFAPVKTVRPGDVVEVRAGETIAVDGVIREGTGFVSESPVSGEPFPMLKRPGDSVLAGTASYDATFHIEATRRGTERHIDRILAVVDEARDTPVSLQSQADRLARWFLPLVMAVSIGTFAFWSWRTDWQEGLFNAMAVLLVACPCAIGLATPVAVWGALGRLAERGLVVRSAGVVERLAEVDRVLLDKTGTLTDEDHRIRELEFVDDSHSREAVLSWLSLVESQSNHPLAKPFAELPRRDGERVCDVRAVPGCGIEGTVIEADGTRHLVKVGRSEWVGGVCDSRVAASVDGRLAVRADVAERVRSSTAEAFEQFQNLDLPAEVLTGAAATASWKLAAMIRAGLLPDEKRAIAAEGRSLMVGDGINDAAALAAAHVGIAMANGTDLAVEAADATLYGGDLRVLPWAVAVSRDAARTVRHNLIRAVVYNVAGMALAAAGWLHPIAAVLLMMASSISLLAASARVRNPNLHCVPKRERQPGWEAIAHGLAFAVQGVLLMRLAEESMTWAAAFAAIGTVIAIGWLRWKSIPHGLDMAIGMLTVGNFGMLLGWCMDAKFEPVQIAGCEVCLAAAKQGTAPGMWIGMLIGANIGMAFLGRNGLPRGTHRFAMFTGGNVGMMIGMILGGRAFDGVLASFAGMTVGMLAGMFAGTWLIERMLRESRSVTYTRA